MKIRLLRLDYSQEVNQKGKNPWELKGLIFSKTNLIVGKNSAGKSRTARVLYALANIISLRSQLTDGNFDATFLISKNSKDTKLRYKFEILDKKVQTESIQIDGKVKLERKIGSKTDIFSEREQEWLKIDPPDDKLVLHIRRDKTEYPYFEDLIEWASNAKGFKFANTSGDHINVPTNIKNLQSLNEVPTAIDMLSAKSLTQIINDVNAIGYEIEAVKTEPIPGTPVLAKAIKVKEKSLKEFYFQSDMSQGMFRAFALVVFIQLSIENGKGATIVVDDLCEGLDYEHSSRLAKYLYSKAEKADIQLIATTNDHTLMNVIDIENWNIFLRKGTVVNACNYANNKKLFDEFKLIGLSNFDIFTSSLLTRLDNNQWN